MKNHHYKFLVFIFLFIAWAFPTIAGATVRDDVINRRIKACAVNYEKMIEAKVVLEESPREEWTDAQMQTYLYNALWAVFNGMVVYKFEFDELCVSLDDLVALGYFPEIPGNPFSNWEPVKLAQGNPGFSPGNLFIILPPAEYHSYVSDGQGGYDIKPLSYELGVFGPTIEFARTGLAVADPENPWTYVPEGTYFMLGAFRETVSQTEEKWAARAKYKAELAAQEQEEAGNE